MSELIVSATEMRRHFDEYMQRIKSGETIIITRYGKPIAQFAPVQRVQKVQESHHTKEMKSGR